MRRLGLLPLVSQNVTMRLVTPERTVIFTVAAVRASSPFNLLTRMRSSSAYISCKQYCHTVYYISTVIVKVMLL